MCVCNHANERPCLSGQAFPSLLLISTLRAQRSPSAVLHVLQFQLKQLALAQFWHGTINTVTRCSISNFAAASTVFKRRGKKKNKKKWICAQKWCSVLNAAVQNRWGEQSVSPLENGTDAAIFSPTYILPFLQSDKWPLVKNLTVNKVLQCKAFFF